MTTPDPKRPVGRPRTLDPDGSQSSRPVKLTDDEAEFLRIKFGSVNRGVRALVERAMRRKK